MNNFLTAFNKIESSNTGDKSKYTNSSKTVICKDFVSYAEGFNVKKELGLKRPMQMKLDSVNNIVFNESNLQLLMSGSRPCDFNLSFIIHFILENLNVCGNDEIQLLKLKDNVSTAIKNDSFDYRKDFESKYGS